METDLIRQSNQEAPTPPLFKHFNSAVVIVTIITSTTNKIIIKFTVSVIVKPYTNNFTYFFSFICTAAHPRYVFSRNNIHVRFKISNPPFFSCSQPDDGCIWLEQVDDFV